MFIISLIYNILYIIKRVRRKRERKIERTKKRYWNMSDWYFISHLKQTKSSYKQENDVGRKWTMSTKTLRERARDKELLYILRKSILCVIVCVCDMKRRITDTRRWVKSLGPTGLTNNVALSSILLCCSMLLSKRPIWQGNNNNNKDTYYKILTYTKESRRQEETDNKKQ